MKQIYYITSIVFILIFIISCSTTQHLTSLYYDKNAVLTEPEKKLWKGAEEFEKTLEQNPMSYNNPSLEKYLNRVLSNLVQDKEIINRYKPHVRIVKNPLLNAAALPTGTIIIHSGILARLDNEAQLAAILGHELTHFLNRHAYRSLKNSISESRTRIAVSIFFSIALLPLSGAADTIGEHWELAAISGYSRELEREADESALVLMAEAGYDPREAVSVFGHMKKEYDQAKIREPFYYGSHPLLNQRISMVEIFLEKNKNILERMKIRKVSGAEYSWKIADLLLDNAELDIEYGRFNTAMLAIQKHLAVYAMSWRGHYCKGKLILKLNEGPASIEQAMREYQLSIRLNPAYPLPHREIGLIYYDRKDRRLALYEFNQYLSLAKNPIDGPIIRQYIYDLSK
jgi:beta-barrel assembly-enhancing protease